MNGLSFNYMVCCIIWIWDVNWGKMLLCTENGGFKVVRVLITLFSSNLECVIKIEYHQVQGHLKVIQVFLGGLASNLELVITMECQTRSRSSQGHWDIYYWIGLKLSTRDRDWGRTCSRSSEGQHLNYFDKNNNVDVLDMDRDERVSTVTPSSDIPLWGQMSKRSKFRLLEMTKIPVSIWFL